MDPQKSGKESPVSMPKTKRGENVGKTWVTLVSGSSKNMGGRKPLIGGFPHVYDPCLKLETWGRTMIPMFSGLDGGHV